METRDSGTFLHQEKNMFDMQKVGERIAALRRKENMTQADLADKLGISYQAVSSWERGATMPDIGKLVELARTLRTTVDALLSGEMPEEAAEAENAAEEKIAEETESEKEETLESFSGSLHDLMTRINGKISDSMKDMRDKLNQMKIEVSGNVKYSEENGKPVITIPAQDQHNRVTIHIEDKKQSSRGRVSSDTIGALACYMDQETLEDELVQAINDGDDDTVEEIACYLEPETIDRAMERADEPLTGDMIEELATYMSHGALEECAVQALNEGDDDTLEEIICHMDSDVIERALERCTETLSCDMVETLACHASELALDLIIQKCDLDDSDVIEELAPYINQRQMRELLKRARNS